MTEIQISPIESIKREVERQAGKVRSAIAVTGMVRKTPLPAGEGGEVADAVGKERALDERFERGAMFRIIKRMRKKRTATIIKEEKEVWNKRLHAAGEISGDLRRNLDVLNRQYYSPEYMQFVGVEVLGEDVEIPVRRYSLKSKDLAESDGQSEPPIVIIGGATSGPTVTKSTAEAFALQYPRRDVYVIGYPDSNQSKISEDLPEKLNDHGNLATYTKINKDVLLKMGFEKFDLVGISMGGGIVLQAVTDTEFAKRINNLIAISPTNIQKTETRTKFSLDFGKEILYSRMHPRQWLRVPQVQPGYTLGSHKGMGLAVSGEISRHKSLSADDFAGIHVQGRVIIATGRDDALISCKQIRKETASANKLRMTTGKKPIEFMQVDGAHHSLGDVYAAGIVALVRNTETMPNKISVKDVLLTTAEVLVAEHSKLSFTAPYIIKNP